MRWKIPVGLAITAWVWTAVAAAETPQTIDFTQPPSPLPFVAGLRIPLVATGGASGKPVVFSIDASSIGTGTVSGRVLTITGPGTVIIDANQAGGSNFSAAPQVRCTIVILTGSSNGGTGPFTPVKPPGPPAPPGAPSKGGTPGQKAPGRPQSKAPSGPKKYEGILMVSASSTESVTLGTGQPGGGVSSGTANFDLDSVQAYEVQLEDGIVSLTRATGPASLGLGGSVSTNAEAIGSDGKKVTWSESFVIADKTPTIPGGLYASILSDFDQHGRGLAFRVEMGGVTGGICFSSVPPGNMCMDAPFEFGGGGTLNPSDANTLGSPIGAGGGALEYDVTFDFFGKPDPSDPSSSPNCDAEVSTCFTGGDVDIPHDESGRVIRFSGNGVKSITGVGGLRRSWQVNIVATIWVPQ